MIARNPMADRYGTRQLKPRELCLIEFVAAGLKNKEIAAKMATTRLVIKNRVRVIYDKLGLDSRLQLALWWEAHLGPYSLAKLAAAAALKPSPPNPQNGDSGKADKSHAKPAPEAHPASPWCTRRTPLSSSLAKVSNSAQTGSRPVG